MILDVIERVSLDPSLSIASEYGRIMVHGIWYRYDTKTDRLIRCATEKPPQADLFESSIREKLP